MDQEPMNDQRNQEDFQKNKTNITDEIYKNVIHIPKNQIVDKINDCRKYD